MSKYASRHILNLVQLLGFTYLHFSLSLLNHTFAGDLSLTILDMLLRYSCSLDSLKYIFSEPYTVFANITQISFKFKVYTTVTRSTAHREIKFLPVQTTSTIL